MKILANLIAGIRAVWCSEAEDFQGIPDTACELIEADEGYNPYPYQDTDKKQAIGFGTQLPIWKTEARLLLDHRLGWSATTWTDWCHGGGN